MEVGGWVQVSLGFFWKITQNSYKTVLMFVYTRRSFPR